MIRMDLHIPAEDLRRLRAIPAALDWAIERSLQRASAETAREMRERAPKAFSTLANSVDADRLRNKEWQVLPHVNYAEHVIRGRDPGKRPPFQPIFDWVRVKGIGAGDVKAQRGIAWAIVRKIGEQGVQGQDFITPTAETMEKRIPDIVFRFVREALSQ